MSDFVIFTDLDGTLLDATTYSFEPAQEALRALRTRGIPLILVSSKTLAEMQPIRASLSNRDPFIVENGGCLYVPSGYFQFPLKAARPRSDLLAIEFGTPYAALRRALVEINEIVGGGIRGFGDMSLDEVAALTGLTPSSAQPALQREYDEPFIMNGSPRLFEEVKRLAEARGLCCTSGDRFHHLMGKSDKGRACLYLIDCYRRHLDAQSKVPTTVAVGDSRNDLPMLAAVERPILLPRRDGSYEAADELPAVRRAPGMGPAGWNAAIMSVLGV